MLEARFTTLQDFFQYTIEKIEHILVYESNYKRSVAFKYLSARRIIFRPMPMRFTIEFNDQICFVAIDVRDEFVDDMLPTEFETVQLAITQALPEFLLGGRRISSHLASEA